MGWWPMPTAKNHPANTVAATLSATGTASGHIDRKLLCSPRRTDPTRSSNATAAMPLNAN